MIAVVGNGPMNRNGKFIDSFETVIRFNRFQTKGYEDLVGTKTSIWAVSCNNPPDMIIQAQNEPCKEIWLVGDNFEHVHKFETEAECRGVNLIIIPYHFEKDIEKKIKKRPTTGISVVNYVMSSGVVPYLIGFTGRGRLHYYEIEHVETIDKNHGWDEEQEILEGWENSGKIKIYPK